MGCNKLDIPTPSGITFCMIICMCMTPVSWVWVTTGIAGFCQLPVSGARLGTKRRPNHVSQRQKVMRKQAYPYPFGSSMSLFGQTIGVSPPEARTSWLPCSSGLPYPPPFFLNWAIYQKTTDRVTTNTYKSLRCHSSARLQERWHACCAWCKVMNIRMLIDQTISR